MRVRCEVLEYTNAAVRDGVIVGVKIIGTQSRNGRTYPMEVLRRAKPLYECAPVFLFHPDGREKKRGSRQLADHFGSLVNVRERGEENGQFGLFADLQIKQRHPMASLVLENTDKNFGLSHNAVVEMDETKTEVREIISVNSVDLVDNPATTTTLFEESEMTLEEMNAALDERLGAFETKILEAMKSIKPAPVKVTEEKEPAKPKRITALEAAPVDAGGNVPAPIGNTHEDLLAVLRGYSTA